jgi:hypothetical protein
MSPILFVTDLDNTLVGDDDSMIQLNDWLEISRQQLGSKIAYSTGRSLTSYRQLCNEKPLLVPDILVVSVGTEVYYVNESNPDPAWTANLAQGWNREQVSAIANHFPELVSQPSSEQRPFKVSYFLTPTDADVVLPSLENLMRECSLEVQLVYSGSKDLDILPCQANKGMALCYLQSKFGFTTLQTIACGDSGNDLSMFSLAKTRGIIVANAQPELLNWHYTNPNPDRYLATAPYAAGILEGLQHFGIVNS